MRLIVSWLVLAAAGLGLATPTWADVTASFVYAPASPQTGDRVTFTSTSTSTGLINAQDWDLDGDGRFDDASGPTATRTFSSPGNHTVGLQVTDDLGVSAAATDTVTVLNRPPRASFTYSPEFPDTGQLVTFTSTSSDPERGSLALAWDLDNDGAYDDGTARTVTRSFAAPGNYTVRLRARDPQRVSSFTSRLVKVGNRPPTSSFIYFPSWPFPDEKVSFASTAGDPDGPLAGQAWDLDGNGSFNDASGSTASRAFSAPGTYTVGLRVVDNDGAATATSRLVVVVPKTAATVAQRIASTRVMTPFPVVRIAGAVRKKGTRLRRLLIYAPSGASVVVRCRGRGCPFRKRSYVAAVPRARIARLVRVRRFERRLLRPGVVIKVFVTKRDAIGKYTRFRIRKGHSPTRVDRCMVPGVGEPVRCPPL